MHRQTEQKTKMNHNNKIKITDGPLLPRDTTVRRTFVNVARNVMSRGPFGVQRPSVVAHISEHMTPADPFCHATTCDAPFVDVARSVMSRGPFGIGACACSH